MSSKVRFRGWADCISGVKGLRVHIQAFMDFGVVNENNAAYATCGSPTSPPNYTRCPVPAQDDFSIATPLRSGCHAYYTYVWIDVVWIGTAFWSLRQDQDQGSLRYLGPGC